MFLFLHSHLLLCEYEVDWLVLLSRSLSSVVASKMLETILVIITIFLIAIYGTNYAIHNTRAAKLFDQIPGPEVLPVLGNLLDFVCSPSMQIFNIYIQKK